MSEIIPLKTAGALASQKGLETHEFDQKLWTFEQGTMSGQARFNSREVPRYEYCVDYWGFWTTLKRGIL